MRAVFWALGEGVSSIRHTHGLRSAWLLSDRIQAAKAMRPGGWCPNRYLGIEICAVYLAWPPGLLASSGLSCTSAACAHCEAENYRKFWSSAASREFRVYGACRQKSQIQARAPSLQAPGSRLQARIRRLQIPGYRSCFVPKAIFLRFLRSHA